MDTRPGIESKDTDEMTQPGSAKATKTPRVESLLEGAAGWSARLGHPYLGTEHLLLSMIDDKEGIAGSVLHASVDVEALRADVLDRIARSAQIKQTSVVYPVGFPREKRIPKEHLDADGLVEGPDYEP